MITRRAVSWPPPDGSNLGGAAQIFPTSGKSPPPRPTAPARPAFIAAIDLGQAEDFTALSIVRPQGRRLHLLALERTRHRSYVGVVDLVVDVVRDLVAYGNVWVCLDVVGLGRPVGDLLRSRGVRFTGVAVHGGSGSRILADGTLSIPKRDLIHGLVLAFEQHRLLIPASLPLGDVLQRELASYVVKIGTSGHDAYAAEPGAHDDFVFSLALAAWQADRLNVRPGAPVAGGRRDGPLRAHAERIARQLAGLPDPAGFTPSAGQAARLARHGR